MLLFVENWNITFIFINHIIEKQIICTKLSQNSFMLFILYLFFNVNLLKLIDKSKIKTIAINFVNNINLLIYLSYRTKRFNMCATMKINDVIIKLKIDIKVLKLQINIKLKWHFHIKTFKILIFTWKMFFIKTKQIYLMIICSIMIYTLTIWYEFINKLNENPNNKFFVTQNKYLRVIINVFKIILIWILKTKTIVLLFTVHLNRLQTKVKIQLRNSNCSQQIKAVYDKVTRRLRDVKKWPTRRNPISKQKKIIWTKELTQKCQNKMILIKICKSWTNNMRKQKTIKNKSQKMMLIKKQSLRTKFMNDWISHWMIYQNQLTYSTPVHIENLKKSKIK